MVSIGQKTLDVVNLYNSGVPILDIAKKLDISTSSVEKRLRSYKKFKAGGRAHKVVIQPTWETDKIKDGFERFVIENGRLPTSGEVDSIDYLPSARQIQRRYGGLRKLREQLGYEDVDFGIGKYRSAIAQNVGPRGSDAERELEILLVNMFGEVYVHSETHYGPRRNRVDFVVYTKDSVFGIDVFVTNTRQGLQKNVNHKVIKYVDFPQDVELFFLLWKSPFSQQEIDAICQNMVGARNLNNLRVVNEDEFLGIVGKKIPLLPPEGFVSILRQK